MKKIVQIYFLKLPLLFTFLCLTSFAFSQNKNKNSAHVNKCTTYVYNLTTGEMKIRDICFQIEITDHFDLNEFNIGKEREKENDTWKFLVSISDNEKFTTQNFNASFYLYEESSEIKQYHCKVDNSDFKALIFDKIHNCWQVLLLQNDEYKILSPYTGYHFTNAFGIIQKSKSSIDY